MEKENNIRCGSDLYEKIIDAACKASQIGDMVECVTWLIEMQHKLDLYIYQVRYTEQSAYVGHYSTI